MKKEHLIEALQWRYATKIFDSQKEVSEADLHTILEAGRLSPSSSGIEPWKFIVVKNPELRKKMREASHDQPKVTDATYIVVIAHRTDGQNLIDEAVDRTAKTQGKTRAELEGYEKMVTNTIHSKTEGSARQGWLAAQTYIALGIMIATAANMHIDTGPMEGFEPDKIDEILGLKAKNLHATTMLAIGHRGEDHHAKLPKTRRTFEDAVEIIS